MRFDACFLLHLGDRPAALQFSLSFEFVCIFYRRRLARLKYVTAWAAVSTRASTRVLASTRLQNLLE